MKAVFLILAIFLLSGCAAQQQYPNELRINQYGAAGQYIPFVDAQLGGVVVQKKGNMAGITIIYKDGDKVNITVNGENDEK